MALELPALAPSQGIKTDAATIPPRTRLLQNISTQTHLINQIFTSLSSSTSASTSAASTPLPDLYQALKNTTDELLRLREDVAVHQELWARIEAKKKNVIDLERRVRGIMRTLERERCELETMVQEGRDVISSVDKVEKSECAHDVFERERLIARPNPYPIITVARSRIGQALFCAYIELVDSHRQGAIPTMADGECYASRPALSDGGEYV